MKYFSCSFASLPKELSNFKKYLIGDAFRGEQHRGLINWQCRKNCLDWDYATNQI
jgi:hypothetical protein